MAVNFTDVPTSPQLMDVLNLLKKQTMLNINCHAVGTVRAFNPENQACSVQINYQVTQFQFNTQTNQYDPHSIPYPTISACPMVILSGGLLSLRMPVTVGDECLVFFNDRDLESWYLQGTNNQTPNTNRLHSFADAIALVGVRSIPNKLSDYDPLAAELTDGTASLKIGGEVPTAGLYNGVGKLTKVEVNSETIAIANAVTSLGIQLDALLVGLSAMLTLMGTATPPTVVATVAVPANAFNAIVTEVQTALEGLLE